MSRFVEFVRMPMFDGNLVILEIERFTLQRFIMWGVLHASILLVSALLSNNLEGIIVKKK